MRLGRTEFWALFAATMVANYGGSYSSAAWLLPLVVLLVLRLRDAGRPGWLVLAPLALLVVTFLVGLFWGAKLNENTSGDGPALMGMLVGVGAGLLGFLGFSVWAGFAPSRPRLAKTGER